MVETSSSQALNLSVEEVPPSLWSSLPAWVRSWVNWVDDIFRESLSGMIVAEDPGGEYDGKRKRQEHFVLPTLPYCAYGYDCHSVTANSNGDCMDLVQSVCSRWLIIRTFWYCMQRLAV